MPIGSDSKLEVNQGFKYALTPGPW